MLPHPAYYFHNHLSLPQTTDSQPLIPTKICATLPPEGKFNNNIATLRCDLCSMLFLTPAEWVRHVQKTHTESELALSNKTTAPKRNRVASSSVHRSIPATSTSAISTAVPPRPSAPHPNQQRPVLHTPPETTMTSGTHDSRTTCSICKKSFSSYGNMILHKRTHLP